MKERPILFSGPMVRAILASQKTQTRRLVKPQPQYEGLPVTKISPLLIGMDCHPTGEFMFHHPEYDRVVRSGNWCPYGKPGDRLWVRETWASPESDKSRPGRVAYDADGVCGCWIGGGDDRDFVCHGRVLQASGFHSCFPKTGATTRGLADYTDLKSGEYPSYKYGWRPSIHMPRWASRITLEIADVRVERLQEISERDAAAEGSVVEMVENDLGVWVRSIDGNLYPDAVMAFYKAVWSSIHTADGPNGLAANPWVWVLEFRRVDGNR